MATWDTWRDIVFTETPPVENRSFPSCLSLEGCLRCCPPKIGAGHGKYWLGQKTELIITAHSRFSDKNKNVLLAVSVPTREFLLCLRCS